MTSLGANVRKLLDSAIASRNAAREFAAAGQAELAGIESANVLTDALLVLALTSAAAERRRARVGARQERMLTMVEADLLPRVRKQLGLEPEAAAVDTAAPDEFARKGYDSYTTAPGSGPDAKGDK